VAFAPQAPAKIGGQAADFFLKPLARLLFFILPFYEQGRKKMLRRGRRGF